MTITLTQARKLLSAAEFELFEASRADALKALTAAQLRGKIKRTRTLRDKYQGLLRRQKLATRDRTGSKTGPSGSANARTPPKVSIFDEMLARFDKRLAQLDAAARRAARQSAAARQRLLLERQRAAKKAASPPVRSTKAPAKVPAAPDRVGSTSEGARAARHAMQPKQAGLQRVQAHVASRGRREQAKRDSCG